MSSLKLATILLAICFFYSDKGFAYTANVYGCDVEIPESYEVNSRIESDGELLFTSRVGFRLSVFSMRTIESLSDAFRGLDSLEEQGGFKREKVYEFKGFVVAEYENPITSQKLDAVISRDQVGTFLSDSRSLWPSWTENCDSGLQSSDISYLIGNKETHINEVVSVEDYTFEVLAKIRQFSQVTVVRSSEGISGYRLYSISKKLADLGVKNGDLILGVCGENIRSSAANCEKVDHLVWHITVQSNSEKPVNFSIPRLLFELDN